MTSDSAQRPALARADHSRFVQRIRRRYAAELPLLSAGLPDTAAIRTLVTQLREGRHLIYRPALDRMSALMDYLAAHCCQAGGLADGLAAGLADCALDSTLGSAKGCSRC